jgi:hypothetical protein
MKKIKLLVLSITLAVASISYGGISISYSTSSPIKWWNGASLVNLPAGCLVQLIWSADSSIETAYDTLIPSTGGQYGGGDYVLLSKPTTSIGGFTDTQMDGTASYQDVNVGGANILSGYVYVMVFGSATPSLGTYYGVSSLAFPLNNVDGSPPGSPNVLNVSPSPGLIIGPVSQGGQGYQVVAVPEPSTVGLLLVGVGLMAARRFRRS